MGKMILVVLIVAGIAFGLVEGVKYVYNHMDCFNLIKITINDETYVAQACPKNKP